MLSAPAVPPIFCCASHFLLSQCSSLGYPHPARMPKLSAVTVQEILIFQKLLGLQINMQQSIQRQRMYVALTCMSLSYSTKAIPGRASTSLTSLKPANCLKSMLSISDVLCSGRFSTNRILLAGVASVLAAGLYTDTNPI